jgi:hypothetical protein
MIAAPFIARGCMRLRANITIEFESLDFVDAAKHQRQLELFVKEIGEKYADVKLAIRERRTRHTVRFGGQHQAGRVLSVAK